MKESCGEGLAAHTGPGSCVGRRKETGEALTGVHADQTRTKGKPARVRAFLQARPFIFRIRLPR
jgi:hypothetical protein